jgi:hypothetical protein
VQELGVQLLFFHIPPSNDLEELDLLAWHEFEMQREKPEPRFLFLPRISLGCLAPRGQVSLEWSWKSAQL